MPIDLDPTVAGASATTFGTVAEANAYFALRIGAAAWTGLVDADLKSQALATAAQRITAEVYRGALVSADQALAFPRTGLYRGGQALSTSAIPLDVKHAQFEEAFALLVAAAGGTADPLASTGLDQFTSIGVGDIRLDLRDPNADAASRTMLSPQAYRLLRPYIITDAAPFTGARNVRLLRG